MSAFRGQVGEQRLRQPFDEKSIEADVFDPIGKCAVAGTAGFAFGRIRDARRSADQHDSLHVIWMMQRRLQAEPCPHGVADIHASPARLDDGSGGVGEGQRLAVVVAVAWRIERLHGESSVEQFIEGRPALLGSA